MSLHLTSDTVRMLIIGLPRRTPFARAPVFFAVLGSTSYTWQQSVAAVRALYALSLPSQEESHRHVTSNERACCILHRVPHLVRERDIAGTPKLLHRGLA